MKPATVVLTTLLLGILAGCSPATSLTMAERERQDRADAVVANTLFDSGLDTAASYNVRKNGLVVIKFDPSVSRQTYTEVVQQLRAHEAVGGVRAEQGGVEVCPLRN